MVITIFGDSCTGKSTIAEQLKNEHSAVVYTGKDYLRLAANEAEAQKAFTGLLHRSLNDCHTLLVYVITEKPQLSLVPDGAVRVLVTAPLDVIKRRFAARAGGTLTPPVVAMLERKFNTFVNEPRDLHIDNASVDFINHTAAIMQLTANN